MTERVPFMVAALGTNVDPQGGENHVESMRVFGGEGLTASESDTMVS
jgi:hypothetical protein